MQPSTQNAPRTMTGRTKGALWLLIGPTGLLIVVFTLYAVLNWVLFYMSPSPIISITNTLIFVVGSSAMLAWLPSLVIGIILLATAKK